eukprot:Tbor_TRINITY_DN7478_c0_g1::TRINITY_DN7478_c0_g1_i1::g.14558::m.14558
MMSESVKMSTYSRAKRLKADAVRKAVEITKDSQTRVMDPDVPSVDRTPLPLFKRKFSEKGLARRAADGNSRMDSINLNSKMQYDSVMASQPSTSSSGGHGSSSTPYESSIVYEESSESRSVDRSTMASDMRIISSEAQSEFSMQRERALRNGFDDKNVSEEWTSSQRSEWLNAPIHITLSQSPVVFLFNREDGVEDSDTPIGQEVIQRNLRYDQFCEARTRDDGGNRYSEHATTTLNDPKKSVKSFIAPPLKSNGGVHVTPWKIYDEYMKLVEEEEAIDEKAAVDTEAVNGTEGDEDVVEDNDSIENDSNDENNVVQKTKTWMMSETLLETVLVMERAVVQNIFEELQLAYRGLEMPILNDTIQTDETNLSKSFSKVDRKNLANEAYGAGFLNTQADKKEEEERERKERRRAEMALEADKRPVEYGKIRELWKFSYTPLLNKSVMCMSWNRTNSDILAAGYGTKQSLGRSKEGGVVCCWSLKNPAAPERVITLESDAGVSSMNFSSEHPSLLAVGSTDGTLALYDIRRHGNNPAMKTSVSTGQHTGIVWEAKWINRGNRGESLMSVSADGHVMEWSIKKGLERSADLMKLKRVPNQNSETGGNLVNAGKSGHVKEAILSRQSGGMTFDVSPKDHTIYVVGTEDGTIHKCSKSQNENYLMDFKSHEEPVYRLCWSPFSSQYFLTCSADWTSRLYRIDRPNPIVQLDGGRQEAVHDISWSHTCSTTFATATSQGRVNVWDLCDPLEPKAIHEIEGQSLNCLLFAHQESPVIAVGDSRGDVTILKLNGSEFERNGMTDLEQEDRLNDVVHKIA